MHKSVFVDNWKSLSGVVWPKLSELFAMLTLFSFVSRINLANLNTSNCNFTLDIRKFIVESLIIYRSWEIVVVGEVPM